MEAIVAMNTEGLTNYAIAKRTGKTKQAIGQMLARAETLGFTIKDNRRYPLGKG
jgi:transposase